MPCNYWGLVTWCGKIGILNGAHHLTHCKMSGDRRHQVVGHYVVLKLIGKGSYGQVHLVKNRRDKRQV